MVAGNASYLGVVSIMVNAQSLLINMRLKSSVIVREGREFDGLNFSNKLCIVWLQEKGQLNSPKN